MQGVHRFTKACVPNSTNIFRFIYISLLVIVYCVKAAGSFYDVSQSSNVVPSMTGNSTNGSQSLLQRVKRGNYDYEYYRSYRFTGEITINNAQAAYLEKEHNKYRGMVRSTNMEYMYWDNSLARSAQVSANRCDYRHNYGQIGRLRVGENIMSAPHSSYVPEAVSLFYNERYKYNCGIVFTPNCGHYTQVVWATSNRVGCALAKCNYVVNLPPNSTWQGYSFVCHYSLKGNTIGIPAFRYQYGGMSACSECPEYAKNCFRGLCLAN